MVRKNSCPRLIFCLVCCLFFENTALGFGGGVATGVIQGKDPLQSGLAGGIGAGLSEMVAEKVLESHRDELNELAKTQGKDELNDIEKTQGKEVAQKRFNDIKKTAAKWGKIIAITTAFTGNLDPEVALQAANTSIDNNFFETMDYALFLNPKGAEIQKEVAEKMVETVKNMYEDRYSILLDMSPAGPYKNIQELITGQDLVTGKPVSRCVSGVSLGLAMAQPAVGFAKGALKAGTKELAIGMKAATTLSQEVAPALKTLENQLAPTLEKQLAPVLENQGLGLAKSAMKTEVEVGKSLLKEEVGVAKSLTSNELKSVGEELSKPTVEVATQLEFDFVKDVGKTEVGAAKSVEKLLTSNELKGVGKEVIGFQKIQPISQSGKVFNQEQQALVEMAKWDKIKGITKEDINAYIELNRELGGKGFPLNKVRGPERHLERNYSELHGHVGPVDHIPIKEGQINEL